MKTATSLLLLSSLCFGTTPSSEPINSSLVIYNSNRALVHETKELQTHKGEIQIVFDNVAESIDADSVNVKFPKGITLFSQRYRYDKLTMQKMLEAYIDKEVKVKISPHQYANATLLSVSAPYVLVKDKNNKIIPVKFENITFNSIPEKLITKPSLIWNVDVKRDIDHFINIDYLISNISFESSYVLNIKKDSTDFSGWFNIDNRCGKDFQNTSLSLLAGDVNFAAQPVAREFKAVAALADGSNMQEQSFSGYHYYKLPFKVNLPNNEKTQIKFLSLQDLKFARSYVATLQNPLYFNGEHVSDVMQELSFGNFSQVLPQGIVRVYGKADKQGVFLGESRISHTPKNTMLHINIGKEFDIKVKQTLLQRDEQSHHISATLQYAIQNESKDDKTVTLRIPFYNERSAKVYSQEKYTYTKGNLVTFILVVKANTTKKFTAEFERKR